MQRKQETTRQQLEESFDHLFGKAPFPAALHTRDGRYHKINPRYEQVLGYTNNDLRRSSVRNVTHAQDVAEGARLFAEIKAGQRDSYVREKRFICKDNRILWAQSRVWAVRDEAGELLFLLSIAQDISEKKEMANELLTVREQEQQRLGQDLHDGLCQYLTGIKYKARRLEKDLAAKGNGGIEQMKEITELLGKAIHTAYNMAKGLQGVELEADGLMHGLRILAEETSAMYGIRCTFRSGKLIPMHNATIAAHIYRIAQESISNAVRHGRAEHIAVGLRTKRGGVELSVQDDGSGIPDEKARREGMGLRIMRYRARMMGAKLQVGRGVKAGTQILCSIPRSNIQALI
ncbi:MAG TPA: PAS domain S-box protein [Candidatus Saccharimonadales bacterium]|nr:PAS domain S-box protein [Candidatus Saccharimonadales bacterium]